MSSNAMRQRLVRSRSASPAPSPPKSSHGPVGRTPDGTLFTIPETHDVLSSLADPRLPKSPLDLIIIASLAAQVALFFLLSTPVARVVFPLYFAVWRLAYNAGLGYILTKQSETRWIVNTCKARGWFDKTRQPKVYAWIQTEIQAKMGKSYDMEKMPLEYNVWILFRHCVDVILLNDFFSYCFFAFSYFHIPSNHSWLAHSLRWVGGLTLIFFNLWVKVDAHRIVKDFAWYWGDAFFLSLQELVFDGVFEFAPHPMYSVGYAGYYGLSLITASKMVLAVSIAAHACQFGFLVYFENPHIERTYGKPQPLAARTPLKRQGDNTARPSVPTSSDDSDEEVVDGQSKAGVSDAAAADEASTTRLDLDARYFRHDLLGAKNFDIFRTTDLAVATTAFYMLFALLYGACSLRVQYALLFVNALTWRIFHSFGLGFALRAQSDRRWIVRHFVKHYYYRDEGSAVDEAFAYWKATYNFSLTMTYVSFVALAWKCYDIPSDWSSQIVRLLLGGILISIHIWASRSTYETLGPFGWFYGDFFIEDYPAELYYTGIFRFMNNPERSMGGATFFGLTVICASRLVLTQACIAVLSHWWFLSSVENPHMSKLYGEAIRKDAGVTKTIKRVAQNNASLLKGVVEVQGTVEKVYDETAEALEEFLHRSAPKLSGVMNNTRVLLRQSAERLIISRYANDLSGHDLSLYALEIDSPVKFADDDSSSTTYPRFRLGEPLNVSWRAPPNHARDDWIGVYRHNANSSRLVTKVSSQGRWIGVHDELDHSVTKLPTQGQVCFRKKKLPWSIGMYELRYHHDGKHNVMAVSEPFEICVPRKSTVEDLARVQAALSSMLLSILDFDLACISESSRSLVAASSNPSAFKASQDPTPSLSDPDDFVIYSLDDAQHIAYAIAQAFDVELAPEVISSMANVKMLAKRIVEARRILKGTSASRARSSSSSSSPVRSRSISEADKEQHPKERRLSQLKQNTSPLVQT